MRLLKPSWVHCDGKPIFAVDIHPDGSRFATGGQGEDSGKICIWNLAPVKNEKDELDGDVPKILSQLDNHSGCVNTVRWSSNGKYLASGGDDKLVMIWQTARSSYGPSTAFGTGGTVVNTEQWRCVYTLRGHSGDVLDLAWSPDDTYLASGSVDNSVIIWNCLRFPEIVTTLKTHRGLVKGVTWDPVGKYFASQSDDKTLKVWRISDWQTETEITEPFDECGGTTHVLRLDWSPDGQYVVSAHAMNNGGPVAKIVERDGWKARMDFVGHRKAITCVRFNSRLFKMPNSGDSAKRKQYACCAIGSRDRSLSIWLTSLRRPLVVTHDLFDSSIMDLSWSRDGFSLVACSLDGTIAYVDFTSEELGNPLSMEDKFRHHKQTYGYSIFSLKNPIAASVIENPDVLKVQQQHQEQQEKMQKVMAARQSKMVSPVAVNRPLKTPLKICTATDGSVGRFGSFTSSSSNSKEVATMILKQQIETRTKDGKRRITPLLLTTPPEVDDESMFCFESAQSNDHASADSIPATQKNNESQDNASRIKQKDVSTPKTSTVPQTSSPAVHSTTPSIGLQVKRKLESTNVAVANKRGRKEKHKDKTGKVEQITNTAKIMSEAVLDTGDQISPISPGIHIPFPKAEQSLSLKMSSTAGLGSTDEDCTYRAENNLQETGPPLHFLKCYHTETPKWEICCTSPITALAANRELVCVACQNKTVNVFSKHGRRLLPPLYLTSNIAVLQCSEAFVMVITSKGYLYVWNIKTQQQVVKKEALSSLLKDQSLSRASITENGVPCILLSNCSAYAFSPSLGVWTQLANSEDVLQFCADYRSFSVSNEPNSTLHAFQLPASRFRKPLDVSLSLPQYFDWLSRQASRMLRLSSAKQQTSTLCYLESQVAAALTIRSSEEYHFWLMTYARFLVQAADEGRLRELCDELLGPVGGSENWDPTIMVYSKRDLLKEILNIIASNLRFQRLYSEYQDLVEMTGKR